ncbi:MAG: AAA family ATPase [Clostridia bacterium]
MGIGVLIIGKSGSGKSTSLRNFQKEDVGIINVISKPLPFKNVNNLQTIDTDNYADVKTVLEKSKTKSIVIDDAGYLITNQFMRKHSSVGGGNAVYNLYNDIADNYWNLTEIVKKLPENKIVYFIMHEDKNEFGDIKPKTIGKLIDDKVNLEGLFAIVLRAKKVDKNYYFFTQSTENDVAKSPMGMFEDLYIDNDLKKVDDIIRDFYNI